MHWPLTDIQSDTQRHQFTYLRNVFTGGFCREIPEAGLKPTVELEWGATYMYLHAENSVLHFTIWLFSIAGFVDQGVCSGPSMWLSGVSLFVAVIGRVPVQILRAAEQPRLLWFVNPLKIAPGPWTNG